MRYLLHDVFINTVQNHPNNTAIVREDGVCLSYLDLNKLSNKFSKYFHKHKDGDVALNPYIGIISSVHEKSIAAILGALKIGCAYVPLDEHSPVSRLNHVVNNTKLDLLVVDEHFYYKFLDLYSNPNIKSVLVIGNSTEIHTSDIDKVHDYTYLLTHDDLEPKPLNQVSDDLAYILHSSGSTGIPKGIMLTHRNARTFVDWMQKEFQLSEHDVVMSRAPFKFDLSVFDIFNTFMVGAKLVCFDWVKEREEHSKHSDYVELLSKEGATFLYTTPSTFVSLINRGDLANHPVQLRTVMYAGEPFPIPQLKKLISALPKTKIANIYGPTETNIITYYWVDKIEDDWDHVPLGSVVDDTEIIVVSEDGGHICKTNEIGELWCRGGTVTLGYLGLEEKTKQNLVSSPFHAYPTKFWKTGDFGFKDEHGLLHYRGRKDHMVKVKGFRIEIGEIESAVAEIHELDEFVVVAIPDEKYGNRLLCFYSPLKGHTLSPEDMVQFLSKKIPDYMMPYKFIKMDSLPKTSSGKVDRVSLANVIV